MTQNNINQALTDQDLINYATRLGDDAIVIGHRISEWISNAPFLEEDIALGNVALDFIGHARMYYGYAATMTNNQNVTESETEDKAEGKAEDKTEDDFAYFRDERQFQNHLLHELHKGDFAYSTMRQLLIDIYNKYFLERKRSMN